MKKREIPFTKPHIPESTLSEIGKVLKSGWITTGQKAKEFEQEFAKFINTKNGIAVANGTAALHLAYKAVGIGPGDEVLVPSFTFCSTINMIIHLGATPVFCDIDEKSLCIDPKDVERKITQQTKAIVVVHFAGMPADLTEIQRVANKRKIAVIEDAAHAFMTKHNNHYIGSGRNLACFSFYATKNLTTAEGGMVTTNNKHLSEYIRMLSMHGISKHAWNRYSKKGTWKYDVLFPGYKYNMTDIQAVIGIEQLKVAQKSREKRLSLINRYFEKLAINPALILPTREIKTGNKHAWHLFTIRLKDTSKINRNELFEKLKEFGIGTSVHFIPNHMQSYYKKTYGRVNLPITEQVYKSILSLPLYEDMSFEDVDYVAEVVNSLI